MARLFLHIGSHKTGTTTLQHTLRHNAPHLRDRNFAYVCGPTLPNLHEFLIFADRDSILPAGFCARDPDYLAAALASQDAENVIGSSENFSFFFTAQAVRDLAAALRPLFDDIRIICYLRRQDAHAISHHQEGAKPNRRIEGALWGHANRALPAATAEQRLYLDYDRRLGLWAEAFGQDAMEIAVFDRARLKNGDVVDDFFHRIGLAKDGIVAIPDRNTSLGRNQTKAGHLMTEVLRDETLTNTILNHIPNTGRLLPARAAAQAFLDPYRDSNRRLNARFHLSPMPDLFADDFSDYPETSAEDWTEDSANATLSAVFEALRSLNRTLLTLPPNDLRLAALALQRDNPEAALRLIRAAHALRPNGPAIVRLLADLERRTGKTPANAESNSNSNIPPA